MSISGSKPQQPGSQPQAAQPAPQQAKLLETDEAFKNLKASLLEVKSPENKYDASILAKQCAKFVEKQSKAVDSLPLLSPAEITQIKTHLNLNQGVEAEFNKWKDSSSAAKDAKWDDTSWNKVLTGAHSAIKNIIDQKTQNPPKTPAEQDNQNSLKQFLQQLNAEIKNIQEKTLQEEMNSLARSLENQVIMKHIIDNHSAATITKENIFYPTDNPPDPKSVISGSGVQSGAVEEALIKLNEYKKDGKNQVYLKCADFKGVTVEIKDGVYQQHGGDDFKALMKAFKQTSDSKVMTISVPHPEYVDNLEKLKEILQFAKDALSEGITISLNPALKIQVEKLSTISLDKGGARLRGPAKELLELEKNSLEQKRISTPVKDDNSPVATAGAATPQNQANPPQPQSAAATGGIAAGQPVSDDGTAKDKVPANDSAKDKVPANDSAKDKVADAAEDKAPANDSAKDKVSDAAEDKEEEEEQLEEGTLYDAFLAHYDDEEKAITAVENYNFEKNDDTKIDTIRELIESFGKELRDDDLQFAHEDPENIPLLLTAIDEVRQHLETCRTELDDLDPYQEQKVKGPESQTLVELIDTHLDKCQEMKESLLALNPNDNDRQRLSR